MKAKHHNMVVVVSAEQLAKLHALAKAGDESIARMVRRWLAQRYEATFGDASPPRPKLKHRPKSAK